MGQNLHSLIKRGKHSLLSSLVSEFLSIQSISIVGVVTPCICQYMSIAQELAHDHVKNYQKLCLYIFPDCFIQLVVELYDNIL